MSHMTECFHSTYALIKSLHPTFEGIVNGESAVYISNFKFLSISLSVTFNVCAYFEELADLCQCISLHPVRK